MAGPAPKDPSQRRRRNIPERGEWVNLPPLDSQKAPKMPARAKGTGVWSARTKRAWLAWWADPAVQMWSEAESDTVVDLAFLHDDWAKGDNRLANEVRLRMDGLGLTPKGKKDLRWKVIEAAPEAPDTEQATIIVPAGSTRDRLRAVDPHAAANN